MSFTINTYYTDDVTGMSSGSSTPQSNSADGKEFKDFLTEQYGLDEEISQDIIDQYPENQDVSSLIGLFSDAWDDVNDPQNTDGSLAESGQSKNKPADRGFEPRPADILTEETDEEILETDFVKIEAQWKDVTKDGELSADEIMKNPDLKQYILKDLNFDSHYLGFDTKKRGIEEFIKYTTDQYTADPDTYNPILKSAPIDPANIERLNQDYMNGDRFNNKVVLTANKDGNLPKAEDSDSEWIQVDVGDGKKITFEGEKAGLNYNKFVDLYNNSESMRKSMGEILQSGNHNDFTFRTERKDAEVHEEAHGGYSAVNNDYTVIPPDASYHMIAHEFSHNITQLHNQESHGRQMDLDISNIINEASKGNAEVQLETDEMNEVGDLVGLFTQGQDHLTERLGDSPEVIEAYEQYETIVNAIKDKDPAKAKEAFEKIDKDFTVEVGSEKFKLGDILAEELVMMRDADSRFSNDGLSSAENQKNMNEFIDALGQDDKAYFDNAFKRLNQNPDDTSGRSVEYMWNEYGNELNSFVTRFKDWKGDNEFLSHDKVKEIAKNEDGDWSKEDQITAQFFIDHDEIWNAFDQGKSGDRAQDGDNNVSYRDIFHTMENAKIFGDKFIKDNKEMLDFINSRWDVWNGKDTIVSVSNLNQIKAGKGKEIDKNADWSDKDKEAAEFILNKPEFALYMDLMGSQRKGDDKFGTDFQKWYNENVAGVKA